MLQNRLFPFGMWVGFMVSLCQLQCNSTEHVNKAVTYEGGGRFGDKLISYAHAKWISHKYCIPIIYRPFIYSNKLRLHYEEYFCEDEVDFKTIIRLKPRDIIDYGDSISALYIIVHFGEPLSEYKDETSCYFFFRSLGGQGVQTGAKKAYFTV